MIRDFWWGDKENHRKVHWMSWENMMRHKKNGGIGFRDMHLFNQALPSPPSLEAGTKPR